MQKNILFIVSLLFTINLLTIKYTGFRYLVRDILGSKGLELYFNTLVFIPLVLFFSAVTYFLPAVIFKTWWKFARFAIPATFVLVILINLGWHHTTGGFFNMDADFDRLYLSILYTVFILGSLIQIYRGYRQFKITKNSRGI